MSILVMQYVIAELSRLERDIRRRIGQVIRGTMLVVVGGLISYLVAGFFLLALFFQLADLAVFVQPALITGGVGLLVMLLFILEGWRTIVR